MNWFRQNRFLGYFFIALGVCTLGAVWFVFSAKSDADEATTRLNQTVAELNRLERLTPYPSEENVRKMKAHAEDYAGALAKLKDELKMRVLPAPPLAPNEFQGRLRVAMNAVGEKARANKVKLPDKFYLGFDEFASALPRTEAAPLLGQELTQVEWLLNTLIDARVDALTSLRRTPLPEESGGGATSSATTAAPKTGPAVAAGPKLLERSVVEATFVSTPAAARRALNQIAGASQQFFIVRLLHVRNEKDKGPPREGAADATSTTAVNPSPAGSPGAKPTPAAALNFIVGNEHIETSAKIEIVRFTF
ncbi:MAG: hypothetical protein DLM73_10425 [Chthoniobacterales bacterium]|nr:MAG: hypothetical protein DLM73_10425 [Chthoniobacterales bacterium]